MFSLLCVKQPQWGREGEAGGEGGSVGGRVAGNSCTHVPACSSTDRARGGGADDKLPSAGTLRLSATAMRADVEICGAPSRDMSPGPAERRPGPTEPNTPGGLLQTHSPQINSPLEKVAALTAGCKS